jgi:hypothetical protein
LLISRVNPLYYVMFTTATLCASFILFKGFNTTNAVNTISLLSGFLVIFSGVYLLNYSRSNQESYSDMENYTLRDSFPLENGVSAGMQARRSMQHRRSTGSMLRQGSLGTPKQREATLREALEEEENLGLTQLDDLEDISPRQSADIHSQNLAYRQI